MKKLMPHTNEQWEKICYRCGKCCLIKLEDDESGQVFYTNVICRYYDEENSCCSVYEKRCELVPGCIKLNKDNVKSLTWMPKTCAYRTYGEKKPSQKHTSVKGRCISEALIDPADLENYIVDWEDL